jgi:MYXO-CTERM domain-containing protein
MKRRQKHLALALGTVVGLSLVSGVAGAQALRPNIMILLDTSGSMLYNQANDGSPLCAGNQQANGQTSRVYNMKNAIRAALAQVGTDEANFGLARFPQLENAASTGCPAAHWSNGTSANCATSTTCTAVGGNLGCKLTTQSSTAPETTYGPWFDNGIAESIMVPVTLPSTGLKALAASDYDPTGANITRIYKWIDQSDSGMTGAANPDPELRIPPNTSTPLGRSMFYSRLYFENYVYQNDPRKACRQNILIIATDGAETCDTTAGTSVDPTSCAQTPANSFGTFNPVVQACLAHHSAVIPKGVLVYILTDSGLTTAEKATANQMAVSGGTGQAIFVTLTDTNAVKQALVNIIASNVPPPETCNGVDDNCNGLIDEGVSNLCPVANPNDPNDPDNKLGTAAKHCAVETCNCLDDNCNGQVDEGLPPNACGGPCGCAVPQELCDGLDNNCNGEIDEGFNVGAACDNGQVGACHRTGITLCKADGSGTYCSAPTVTPQTEVCNGIDDNCNGQIDEGTLPGVGETCGNGLGTCSAGTYVCQNGQLVCNATGMPMPEICNGKDDNCDGVIDNGNFPETGQTCLCPGLTQAEIDVPNSTCKAGRLICRGALGFVCEGCVLPTPEICDGKDNNCDGIIDTGAKCPNGFGCKDGQCAIQCTGGEFPCPSGYKCVNDFCVPQRCAGKTCPAGQKCDENTGGCVDLCSGVSCNLPKTCVAGRCIDCNDPALACPSDKICVGGACITDPCKGVSCPAGSYCDQGACKDLCFPGKCPESQRCVAGQCLTDTCANVACLQGQFCSQATGQCETDPCLSTQCGAGMACISQTNSCEDDPCRTIQCPSDCWHCGLTTDGKGTCLLNDNCSPVENKVGQRGGAASGCSCETGGGAGSGWTVTLLLGLALAGARRRRR